MVKKRILHSIPDSRELLQDVFECLDDALLLVEPETWTILGCNPAVEKIFGYRPEEIIGRSPELLHLNLRKYSEMVFPVLDEGRAFRMEVHLQRKDGRFLVSDLAVTEVLDQAGHRLVLVSLVRDITERKQAENLLQIQRDLALALTETNNLQRALQLSLEAALQVSGLECGGIYLRDERDGSLRLAYHQGWSPSFVRAADRYAADTRKARLIMKGRPLYGRHPDLDPALVRAEQREGLQALAIIPINHQKRVIACLNVASRKLENVPPASRTALEAIASQIGLSIRQVRAEEKLRLSEQRYVMAERLAHIGHWERDHQTQEASWSPEVFRIFGLDPKAGVPNFAEFMNRVHPGDRELLRREIEAAWSSGKRPLKARQFEYRIQRLDGTERDILTTLEPAPAADGQPTKLIGTLQDITESKASKIRITAISKAERESLQRDLHDTVCQQLAGLAFLAEEIKQNLFKNPEQAERDLEKLIQINQAALGQAKEVARGLTPLSGEPGALENALREMARTVSVTYRIPCRLIVPPATLLLDSTVSTQLYLIAREAAVNAARHARGQLIRITLSYRRDSVTLRVIDDGRGLDPKKSDPGLGLAIMKQRAELIDARLRIFPGKKRGTVVEGLWKKEEDQRVSLSPGTDRRDL
ncbi:MAG: PAS domain S-box protein [Deltaproteobacteria bacterium]|nr:PAS domain S-box protein [Deltaproteobacteria bacterium]